MEQNETKDSWCDRCKNHSREIYISNNGVTHECPNCDDISVGNKILREIKKSNDTLDLISDKAETSGETLAGIEMLLTELLAELKRM